MNRKQRRVIWAAIALLFLVLLIPPWQQASGGIFRGYAFLFSAESNYGTERAFLIERRPGLRICVSVLLVEALFISLATAGAVAALSKNGADAIGPQQRQNEPPNGRPRENTEARNRRKWVPTVLGALGLIAALLGSLLDGGGGQGWAQYLEIGGCLLALPLITLAFAAGWRLFVKYLI